MKKRRAFQNVAIIVLGLAIIIMSIGYAAYSTPLSITGNTTIQRASWDVKFNNPTTVATATSVSNSLVTGPTITNKTALTFGVTLKVGETYDFTVDVVNAGTFNAKLDTYSLTGSKKKGSTTTELTSADGQTYSNDYLEYSVQWSDDTALKGTADGTADTINAGDTKELKVHVAFKEPTDATVLPEANEDYTFTLNMSWIQNS
jgi:hypothetical protein